MEKKTILQNLSVAFIAQGVRFVLSIIQSLLIPKILGVEQFSYWQLYLFYSSYVGFFHFGLSSGIYLKFGGLPRNKIDKSAVKSQFIFGLCFQSIIAAIIIASALLLVSDYERRFIFTQIGIILVLKNAATYAMNVLQCMNETKKSSASTIVERLSFLIPLVVLLITGLQDFRPYVYSYTMASIAQLMYCLWHLRDFFYAKWMGARKSTILGVRTISVGISLMVANIASMLILGIARFFIDARWGIETFGKLSLVLSLVSFFLTFVNQAGLVLFPALRQSSESEVRQFYISARDALALFAPSTYLFYYPIALILSLWLPAYADAFAYLPLMLPICVFDSKMTITGSTYFNVLRKERVMLLINLISAGLSLLISLLGISINSSLIIIAGMPLVIMLRSLVSEVYLSKELEVKATSLTVWEIGLTIVFILATALLKQSTAFIVYAASYIIYIIIKRDILRAVIVKLKS